MKKKRKKITIKFKVHIKINNKQEAVKKKVIKSYH